MKKFIVFYAILTVINLYGTDFSNPERVDIEIENHNLIDKKKSQPSSTRPRKIIISLIGTSGSGKGTQGTLLSKWLNIPHISVGDLLREEFRNETKIGRVLKIYDNLFFPEQLPDEIPVGLLMRRLSQEDCFDGYILDGFPRTGIQANIIRNVLLSLNDLHIPIHLNISEDEIKVRLLNRYYCPSCGHQVREFDHNPWPGYCPLDANQGVMISLIHRPEDTFKEELERRLKLFRDNKTEILQNLSERDTVIHINLSNDLTPNNVFDLIKMEIIKVLDDNSTVE